MESSNMNIRPKIRNVALVGALAAVAATAWATGEAVSNATYVPAPSAATQPAQPVQPVAVSDSLTTNESLVTTRDAAPAPADAPVVLDNSVSQPAITIEQRRLSEDQRIQAVVMDKLANNPRLSGKIGVESNDAVVRLSGYTLTSGQSWHAERDARSVVGVRYVQNEIRPRVGGLV
jgi:hypothetical protein